jgi:hypothetical protein
MQPAIKAPKDFWAGIVFIGIGVAFLLAARSYAFGTPRQMGSGFFPTLLAWILILIGLAASGRSFAGQRPASSRAREPGP